MWIGGGRGRRRGREETEEEYSATGKGAKESKRDAGGSPERQRHRASSTPPNRQAEEAYYRAHPDYSPGTQVHLTCFPVNLDDRSHLTLFWDLHGLIGARVRRSQRGNRFGRAEIGAYLYFRTATQAARAAREIRESGRVGTAFPALRARQVRPATTPRGLSPVMPDDHRAEVPDYND